MIFWRFLNNINEYAILYRDSNEQRVWFQLCQNIYREGIGNYVIMEYVNMLMVEAGKV